VDHVLACDPAAGRRELARQVGADVVIDPNEDSPYRDHFNRHYLPDVPALMELGVGMREKLGRLPLPWWHVWRLGEALGMGPKSPVIFDCVGAPGLMQTILKAAPVRSRVIVVGVCLALDSFEPNLAMNKEIDISYSPCYTPLDFHDTLRAMGNGSLRGEAMMTGHTGLDGVGRAFDVLAKPNTHAKILVNPQSRSTELTSVHTHSIE
jgi:threonine dehydrogenase-like Zn-dependent dehydrogenase